MGLWKRSHDIPCWRQDLFGWLKPNASILHIPPVTIGSSGEERYAALTRRSRIRQVRFEGLLDEVGLDGFSNSLEIVPRCGLIITN